MNSLNLETEKIYGEFVAIKSLTKSFSPSIQETERILQIEFEGIDSTETLYSLRDFKCFEVYCGIDSIEATIMKLEDRYSELSIENFQATRFRIKYTKNLKSDYFCSLDYYFFLQDKTIEFLSKHEIKNKKEKIFIGIYNVENFSTPTFQFINTAMHEEFDCTKEIDKDFLSKFERLSKNSSNPISLYNNVLSYSINDINEDCTFQGKIKELFYKSFFHLLSYKNNDNKYDVRGKKSITVYLDENFSTKNYLVFANLIDFLFKDEKFLEKYVIVKNVITRYVQDEASFSDLDNKITEISKTTRHYFETYIQNDLDDFFKNRDTVYKEAINTSKSINEQNDKINTYINASLISFLVLIMTFIFKNFEGFDIKNLVFALIGFAFFSITFFAIVYKSSMERYKTIKEQFNLFLDKMGMILPSEKDDITNAYLIKPFDDLKKSLGRIEFICIFVNTLLVIVLFTKIVLLLVSIN